MKMNFYAHSTSTPDKSDWQRLSDHLCTVGRLAAEKASVFGWENLALVAGLLHDLGKYTEKFQQRLEGSPGRVDHSTHGAIEIRRDPWLYAAGPS